MKLEELLQLRNLYHEILRIEAERLSGPECIDDEFHNHKLASLCPLKNPSYCLSYQELIDIAKKLVGEDWERYLSELFKRGLLIRLDEECIRSLHFDLLIRASDVRLNPCANKMVATSRFALKLLRVSDPTERRYLPNKYGEPMERKLYELVKAVLGDYAEVFCNVIKEYFEARNSKGYDPYQLSALIEALSNWNRNVFVITAPTGIGKTEIFLSLMIVKILESLKRGVRPVIYIVYPRKMLEIDQMERILSIIKILNEELKRRHGKAKILLYLRDGDTSKLRKEFDKLDMGKRLSFRGIKCRISSHSGDVFIEKSIYERPKVICVSNDSMSEEYDFVIPFNGIRDAYIDYKNINVIVTNINTLLFRVVAYKDDDIDVRNVARMNMLILDEAHEYKPLLLAYIHYLIKTIKLLKNKVREGGEHVDMDMKIVICSATLGDHVSFARRLAGEDQIVDLSFRTIAGKYSIKPSGSRAILFVSILMKPTYSWQTYLSEYIAAIDFLHYIYKLAGRDFVPQAVVFINNVRELNRTMSVLHNALQLGSPLDNLCIRRYRDICLSKDPRKYRHILRHYLNTLSSNILNSIISHVRNYNTLYDELAKLNDVVYSDTPIRKRGEIAKKLKDGGLACVLATSSLELGVDYPSVSIVINVGFDNEASLIQRFGRGGRDLATLNTVLAIMIARNNPLDQRQFFEQERVKNVVSGSLSPTAIIPIPVELSTLKFLAVLRAALSLRALSKGVGGTMYVRNNNDLYQQFNDLLHIIIAYREDLTQLVDEDTLNALVHELESLVRNIIPDLMSVEERIRFYQLLLEQYLQALDIILGLTEISSDCLRDSPINVNRLIELIESCKRKAYEFYQSLIDIEFRPREKDSQQTLAHIQHEMYEKLCIYENNLVDEYLKSSALQPMTLKLSYKDLKRFLDALSTIRRICNEFHGDVQHVKR